jgi:type IV secretory pathway VirB2 component (pilin)
VNPGFAPVGSGVIAKAVQWLQGTLLGTVATALAVIAVATVGMLLLSGRIDVRRGAQVIFGCFILFGASSIAAGIVRVVHGDNTPSDMASAPPPPPAYPPPTANAPAPAVPYDPYAGAALPTRH